MTPITQAQSAVTNAQNALANAQAALTGAISTANTQTAQIKALNAQLGQGMVRYLEHSGENWDAFTTSGDPVKQSWMRTNVQRFVSFTPFFNDKLVWYQNAYCYFDSYAIYIQINKQPNPSATDHPEWILRDAAGNPLYIPWRDDNGNITQYAGDVSNPAFRADQIRQMKAALIPGWKGLFFDDVNMSQLTWDAKGNVVVPKDQITGAPMLDADWKTYMAGYCEQVRAAFPSLEIVHNSVWFAGDASNPAIKRQWLAADLIYMERGFSDVNIGGGVGEWSLSALMTYVDKVHAAGRSVVIGEYTAGFEQYSLGCYFLTHDGTDYWGIDARTPDNWPTKLYAMSLGPALGRRYQWDKNVWRRDFRNGSAFANEPGAGTVTVKFPTPMYDENNNPMSLLTLGGKTGKVLRK